MLIWLKDTTPLIPFCHLQNQFRTLFKETLGSDTEQKPGLLTLTVHELSAACLPPNKNTIFEDTLKHSMSTVY